MTNVTSTSSENASTVVLEFDGGTNMDSAMVNLSTAVDQVRGLLPDAAGSPTAAANFAGHAAGDDRRSGHGGHGYL